MELKANKTLGQHFLNSTSVLEKIISTANLKNDEIVLEIGPGTGTLTKPLLNSGAKVIAIEKDTRALTLLQEKFSDEISSNKLILKNGDILEEKFDTPFTNSFQFTNSKYAIVANIPYYITGAILEKFLEHEPRPDRMVLLVQKEVAERIVATNKKESILSVSVKAFGEPRIVMRVPRGAFVPAPKVDSAILHIQNISDKKFTEKNIQIKRFFDIVRAGFSHKRKFVFSNLQTVIAKDALQKIWQRMNLDPKIRAENITTEQWFEISTDVIT